MRSFFVGILAVFAIISAEKNVDLNVVRDFSCPRVHVSPNSEIDLPDHHPVIYTFIEDKDAEEYRNAELHVAAQKDVFLAAHGDKTVQLTSSNAHSHGKRIIPLSTYISTMNQSNDENDVCEEGIETPKPSTITTSNKAANETWYLFGNNEHISPFKEMSLLYEIPNCGHDCTRAQAAVVSGIGGVNSGVSFHFHGPGFSEVITGRKRWFLYAPEYEPDMPEGTGFLAMVNMTVSSWVNSPQFATVKRRNQIDLDNNIPFRIPHKDENERLSMSNEATMDEDEPHGPRPFYDCTIEPGEVLYFPSQCMHATLNLDPYTYFVSVFLP